MCELSGKWAIIDVKGQILTNFNFLTYSIVLEIKANVFFAFCLSETFHQGTKRAMVAAIIKASPNEIPL